MPSLALIWSLVSKIEGQGTDQSMHSAAVRHGLRLPCFTGFDAGSPWVGSGQMIGRPSRRAMMNSRLRIVGAP
ncbi:hypothetical protein OA50_05019 [Mameliella alba]|uniref:Uncharacterized protein n=1 Tax=Mameliella alba TaxID=561184 RepID=A0A0B3SIE2_9RHOB|nr:hypothetical protein OA50_05019 [Mameliella alba]